MRQIATGILATMLYVIAVGGAGMALPQMQGAFSAAPDGRPRRPPRLFRAAVARHPPMQ